MTHVTGVKVQFWVGSQCKGMEWLLLPFLGYNSGCLSVVELQQCTGSGLYSMY